MSHSKYRKKGNSLYLDSWNPSAKRFIVTCVQCGAKGFKPSILEQDFDNTLQKKAMKKELMAILEPLVLNDFGLCEHCKAIISMDE